MTEIRDSLDRENIATGEGAFSGPLLARCVISGRPRAARPPGRDAYMTTMWRSQLTEGLLRLGLGLPDAGVERLIRYLLLLEKWNRVFNLTAVRDRSAVVERHLIDSLSVLPHVQGSRLIDVGSGAGLPGLPLALARPDLYVELIDSNSKKTRFLKQAVLELRIPNVEVVHGRVETYVPDAPFDCVVSRAFASVSELWRLAAHLLTPDGIMLAMKARLPEAELGEHLARAGAAGDIVALPAIGGAERHLVRLRHLRG